jgi:(p)ppGpp synthase/HD superfamily hydrolase
MLVYLTLQLNNIEQLGQLIAKFQQMPNVYEVKRT